MEEVVEADRAVVAHGAHHALVVVAEGECVATPAVLAVEEVFAPSDTAYACVVVGVVWASTQAARRVREEGSMRE